MPLSLSRRDRHTLLIGAATVSTLLALGKGWPTWRRWDRAQRSAAVEHVQQLTIAREGVHMLRTMRDSSAARRETLATLLEQLVTAPSVPEASAALAAVLTSDASRAEVQVFSLSVRADSVERDGFARVSVRLSAEGDVAGLAHFVRTVEVDSLLLAVRQVTVTQPDPGAPDSQAEILRMDIVVDALARIDSLTAATVDTAGISRSHAPAPIGRSRTAVREGGP